MMFRIIRYLDGKYLDYNSQRCLEILKEMTI